MPALQTRMLRVNRGANMNKPTQEEVTAAHNKLSQLLAPLRTAAPGQAVTITPEMQAQLDIIMYDTNRATEAAIVRIRQREHRYPGSPRLRLR